MSFIATHPNRHTLICRACGRPAQCIHHKTPRCEGGAVAPENEEPLCFHCHHKDHASKEDWKRWGRNGGKQTAKNPANWMRKLKQYREMEREAYWLYLQWLAYYRGERSKRPMTWKELQTQGVF